MIPRLPFFAERDTRIVVLSDYPSMQRGRLVRGLPPTWSAKDPDDVVDLTADFRLLLGRSIILQADVTIDGDDALSVIECRPHEGFVCLCIAGGTDGLTPIVLLTVTLSDGRRLTRAVNLPIISQGLRPVIDPSALTAGGVPISVGGMTIEAIRPTLGAAGLEISVGGETIDTGG